MNQLATVEALTELGRVRLSKNFFMRDMLYSEVSNVHGIPNIPEDFELAVAVGKKLCTEILEPLHDRFGHVSIRSAYRSPALNKYCNDRFVAGEKECWCTDNEMNAARHIWDRRDAAGNLGATATVVIPSYLEHFERSADYRPLAWWMRDHLPVYAEIFFFPKLCAFNIRWYEGQSDQAIWFLDPPRRELLTRKGEPGFEGNHRHEYDSVLQSGAAHV